ncbi:uncharacterized protein F4822DRAFT_407245 [Hypoxylon trugodes]|uniref:uncharacterized protein n=1 Tax=Hypoxylon trugodes TaxID=326681 RepID=UPI00219BFCDD|nr:uncharacterized protein F4822DRAFT_407245 [Hypoxylon trugodes]KAI1387665.1 hypothetical protein F4822DRAFT_407245 [Hypoxylon trugodes]
MIMADSDINFKIHPLQYQSGSISFTEWCALLTLALAPLIAHIAAGFPQPSYLHPRSPKWHERIALFNPTSVLWRYAAITDRRIRAKDWNKKDMAATNALFWTSRGWDGSEKMIALSSPYCTHLPEHGQISLFSGEFFKTLVVTLQGMQAIVALCLSLEGDNSSSDGFITFVGVDQIFFPLAFIGLMRLFCGFWLTNEFAYSTSQGSVVQVELSRIPKDDGEGRVSLDSLLHDSFHTSETMEERFLPTSCWESRVFRMVFILPLIGFLVMCLLFLVQPGIETREYTVTSSLVGVFYFILLSVTVVIFGYYFLQGNTSSTTIPCIASRWYKLYTTILIGIALAIFILACIETRRTACGRWTSAPYELGDWAACRDSRRPDVIKIDPITLSEFGIATTYPRTDSGNRVLPQGEFWVRNFTGTCLGALGSPLVKRVDTLAVEDIVELVHLIG